MHISDDFKAFTHPTLILITSRQDAIAYLALDRNMEKLFTIDIKKPEFRDNEEHFERSGGGKNYGSGSTEVDAAKLGYQDFLKELNKNIENVEHEFEDVILFVPEEYKSSTPDSLPGDVKSKVQQTIFANVVHEHPTEILKRLQ